MQYWLTYVVVLFVLCLSDALGWDSEYRQGFALSKSVELSDLIVVGRVVRKQYVFRANIEVLATTDVIIAADEVIKGTPNAGKDRVKFMLEGGQVINPNTGEGINLHVGHQAEFALNEQVLLFMVNSTDPYYKNYPYDRFHPYRGEYGKRIIKDDKLVLLYAIIEVHTNTIEGFWTWIKRAWYGTHHRYTRKYAPLYIAEAAYKYNNRKDTDLFGSFLNGCLPIQV